MKLIENKTFDEERALYGSDGVRAVGCRFDGPADGESAFKESKNVETENCFFNLRYPFWHDKKVVIRDCEMTELCRAALWYTEDILIEDSKLHGIKALRECGDIKMRGCDIISPEFGWNSHDIDMKNRFAILSRVSVFVGLFSIYSKTLLSKTLTTCGFGVSLEELR